MEWIENNVLDKKYWDKLVLQNKGLIFNYSWYLDALTENWGVLYFDSNQKKGIAIPYTQKIGQKIVVPPFFFRASSWIGNVTDNDKKSVLNFIQEKFQGDSFVYEEQASSSSLFYQAIQANKNHQADYHKLAKRMLKKANENNITFGNHFDKSYFIQLVQQEIGKKVAMWNTNAVDGFSKLIDSLIQHKCFYFIEILHNNVGVGGLIIMQTEGVYTYLKGVCTPEAKKMGGMYGAMDKAINFAMQNNAKFDFGGSRVDGVANFNRKLGGIDQFYSQIEWNKHPIWFNTLKKFRNKWKKQTK